MLDSPVGKYSAFALHEADPDSISSTPHGRGPPPNRNAGCGYCECGAKGKRTETNGFRFWNPIQSFPTASPGVITPSAESRVTFEHRVARGRTRMRKPSRGSESFSLTTHSQDKKVPEQEGAGPEVEEASPEVEGRGRKPKEACPEVEGRDRKPKELRPEVGAGPEATPLPGTRGCAGPPSAAHPAQKSPRTTPAAYLLGAVHVVAVLVQQAVGLLHALALVHVAGDENALEPGLQLPRPAPLAAPRPLGLRVLRFAFTLPARLRRLLRGGRHGTGALGEAETCASAFAAAPCDDVRRAVRL